jgi:hypothetical protein
MADQIIKQPNGKFCVFSTVVDDIVIEDAAGHELVEYYAHKAAEREAEAVNKILFALDRGEKPYYQFTMTYEEALAKKEFRHGPRTKTQT